MKSVSCKHLRNGKANAFRTAGDKRNVLCVCHSLPIVAHSTKKITRTVRHCDSAMRAFVVDGWLRRAGNRHARGPNDRPALEEREKRFNDFGPNRSGDLVANRRRELLHRRRILHAGWFEEEHALERWQEELPARFGRLAHLLLRSHVEVLGLLPSARPGDLEHV